MTRFWITGLMFLIWVNPGVRAQSDSTGADIRAEARTAFAKNDYVKALPLFRKLLNSFPKEPEYQFSTAVCLINLNGDLNEAAGLLKPSAVTEYSSLAQYFLGRALHLSYDFDNAIRAYSKFLAEAHGAHAPEDVHRLIEMAGNGLELVSKGYDALLQNVENIRPDQLHLAASLNGSGKLMKKPIEFCSKADIRSGYRPWIFLPAYTETNDYIFVPGFESGKKNGKQLYRIRNVNHETWGMPEMLDETINTKYDEEYPYFDHRTSTLYFSSKGHSSMGGYDIFKSVYDMNTKKWSEPVNLGFPVNSPYDDYIYIPDGFSKTISFVSTRASLPDRANVYRIKRGADTSGVQFSNLDEIRKASLFQSSGKSTALLTDQSPDSSIGTGSVKNTVRSDSVFETTVAKLPEADYNRILAEALVLQLRADSAARITRDMRILARETPEDSIKRQLVTDILRNDKIAKELQREADLKFEKARKMKLAVVAVKDTSQSAVTLAREVNGIKVYQYRSPTPDSALRQPAPDKKQTSAKQDDFSIENASPYSDGNPIPRGLSQDSGLVYRIQLGVFSKQRSNDAFGGIRPVAFEQVTGSDMLKYYAGLFFSTNSVTKALETIRSKGFPDAFIVAFHNGKLIPTEKAREIEFSEFRL